MEDLYYLKPNLVIEPLFKRWYAWSYLIPPATAARNVTGRHMKIINSYIQAPQIHMEAVRNPKMKGGPFMDFGRNRVEEVRALREDTLSSQQDLVALSDALKELDQLLKEHAKGYSLEPLYAKVPDILKGYVELNYDLNNQPSFRIVESLLYKSKYYQEQFQSIALWVTENDERPFVLSTPRLDEPNVLHLPVAFNDRLIDEIARMKHTPNTISYLKELLNVSKEDEALLETFFTKDAPPPYQRYEGDKIRMRYFGHACILIETKEVSILVDPLISYYGYNTELARFSDMHLPPVIDYVLITHNHQDHILFETLLPLRHRIRNIVVPRGGYGQLQDPNLKMVLQQTGFKNVLELEEMGTLEMGDCTITGIPFFGEHSDLSISTKICHYLQINDFKIMFAADSCVVEPRLYEHVQKEIGNLDVLFLGMECDGAPLSWLYGPLLTRDLPRDMDASRRLAGSNFERGSAIVDIFQPAELYVYAMGQEPWLEFISSIKYTDESNPIVASNKLISECKEKGLAAERLFGEKEILYNKHKSPATAHPVL
ncbi:L-ascorbate metabolism protein UlaG, beta-lactamase superfamily [Chitinophaga eiseniae]|uniref:L-ascorbate metabolism protein UlaG, beta-lactamase superfamily n=1 Tax=Chitinophaga eiseniae TaxID=634771 RepID=A0A1T4U7G5_9BACT|nr:MBL fold metallo-hydrolase [Chitinophaga eiseniae]SKA48617.1 L-ascorbate metabolism protein UlaG, beta-lactamase superfamily [Chitinophaga eiseniae]